MSNSMIGDKRQVIFDGYDCLSNPASSKYMAASTASQTEIAWASNIHYGKVTVYFGAVVVFLAVLKHVWYLLADRRYFKRTGVHVEPGYFGSVIAILTSYARYFGYKPVNVYISTIFGLPATAGSFLFVIASTAYLACYALIPHFWYRGCAGFGSPPLAIRTGVMATALLPFIYILSGKSNMISMLTGISYEKLNVFHQFTGTASFILAIIHTVPFIYQALVEGGSENLLMNFKTVSYYSGIPPLILMGFLVLGGNSLVRKYWYEAFLHVHWISGMGFYGTLVWHIQDSLNMYNYMWAALAFWMSQLIYRALVKTCFKPNSFFLKPRPAQLTKLDENTFEVLVRNVPDKKWQPGQHCYLRFTGARFLDNHPFSITSMPKLDANELKFIICPQRGLTKVLFDELEHSITLQKKVFIDGPYGGSSRDSLSFETLTMMSTGSGVSATLPFLQNAAQAINSSRDAVVLKDIYFLWIVRKEKHINWIKDQLEEALKLAGAYITVDIYVCDEQSEKTIKINTEAVSDFEKGPASSDSFENSGLISSKNVNIFYHKPSIGRIVKDSSRFLQRRNFFVSSGSASMRREVCQAVSDLQQHIFNEDVRKSSVPVEEVYLHTESFGW